MSHTVRVSVVTLLLKYLLFHVFKYVQLFFIINIIIINSLFTELLCDNTADLLFDPTLPGYSELPLILISFPLLGVVLQTYLPYTSVCVFIFLVA